ncbi:MAG: T9SS type A sorting domain-containing protein [Ignavibacteriaceae bacterium]|nr:T9SS type A sorting domain-containing protein [Ignavibacteriaceae bacterium]
MFFCNFVFYLLRHQNYPNPFNPSTRISDFLPEANFVTLKDYDILGNEIVTLVNESKPSGKFEVEFNGSNLPTGTYIYKLTSGNYQTIRKMLLIK